MSKLPQQVDEIIDELYKSANLTNKKQLDLLVRTLHSSMIKAEQGGIMQVESMVASQTKNPIVIFTWGSNRGELTPLAARGYALQILEASEGAVQDAALYRAVTVDLHLDEQAAFALITGVRNNRRKFEEE
jgi:hypothetical protein